MLFNGQILNLKFISSVRTSGGACNAKNVSKPSSASKPDDSPGVTKSLDPQAANKTQQNQ